MGRKDKNLFVSQIDGITSFSYKNSAKLNLFEEILGGNDE